MMAKEYTEELAEYKANYEVIEKLKHYSSPTTGIQLVFMDLYMSKVISMANELLALLFDGNFVLQQFVINESEFRIPCCGNRIMNDDISSMSTAQICMISMILSFAFLFHSSTKYNILKLDEIDGALDTNNRLGFVNSKNPLSVETVMTKLLPPEKSNDFCHRTVLFGRDVCTARNPKCEICELSDICPKKL